MFALFFTAHQIPGLPRGLHCLAAQVRLNPQVQNGLDAVHELAQSLTVPFHFAGTVHLEPGKEKPAEFPKAFPESH